jgi:carbonic anhydrase
LFIQDYERQLASELDEKTAMQLRLNNSVTKTKSMESPSTVTINSAEQILPQTAEISQAPHPSSSKSLWPQHLTLNPVLPEVAYGWLRNGNTRYVKGKFRNDGVSQADRSRFLSREKPHSIIFSCSDSRVPPEVVFDQKLGEVYVVRSLGLSLDKSAIASIEYAVGQLGVKFLVVMCHEACVSVQTAAAQLQQPSHLRASETSVDYGSPSLNDLISEITPRLKEFSRTPANEKSNAWANVHGAGKDLIRKSPLLRRAIESGQLKLAPALYDLQTGQVAWQ